MKLPIFRPYTMVAHFVLLLFTAGCFGAPVEEEPPDVNLPPHIASDFLSPLEDVVRVESAEPVVLAVESLLDPNPEQTLYYAVIGERSGLIEQATLSRQPRDDLYRNTFYLFDRVEVEIDPCAERLRDHQNELIRIFVADRPFTRVTESEVESEDGYIATHRWLLRFRDQICN